MFKKRLFERIKDLDREKKNICSESEQIRSIINYLVNLLSVQRDSHIINKDSGMSTLYYATDESFSTFTEVIAEEIQKEITNYEPRLKDVIVTYDSSNINNEHIFKIEASLVNYDDKKVILSTVLNRNRKISIEN